MVSAEAEATVSELNGHVLHGKQWLTEVSTCFERGTTGFSTFQFIPSHKCAGDHLISQPGLRKTCWTLVRPLW